MDRLRRLTVIGILVAAGVTGFTSRADAALAIVVGDV